VVHVLHRDLNVGVTHPRLDLDDAGLVDRDRPARVPEVMEPQLAELGVEVDPAGERGGAFVTHTTAAPNAASVPRAPM
jgi:hypothetical protein